MNLKTFVKETFEEEKEFILRPKICCKDGFEMSVQGSKGHYCSPRINSNFYYEMEIEFPSEKEELILEYAEQKDLPTETVYGYVPCEVIQDLIDKHGGIDVEKTINK